MGHIPFTKLNQLGIVVIDQGNGGYNDRLQVKAVDPADKKLQVITYGGGVVYDAQQDDFKRFYICCKCSSTFG